MMRAMLEKSLHRANIAAAFATLADLAGAGGVTAVIRAALSGVALSKIADNDQRALARRMARALEAHIAATAPSADLRAILGQMLARTELTAEALVQGNLNPATVARGLRERIAATATDREHRLPDTLDAFEALLCATLTPILADPAIAPQIQQAVNREVLERSAALERMVAALTREGQARARAAHINEGLLIALARRYAEGDPQDFDAALRGLERALQVAAAERQRGALPANTDDAVNAVIARVDELNERGEIDAAAQAIADEAARATAGLMRLCDAGIAQAILTRNAGAACGYVLQKLPLEVPGPEAQFGALRAEQDRWYERGRDQGLNFDLEVAIALARALCARAGDADQRGAALGTLGNALRTLGEREAGTDRLEAAVSAYRAALQEFTRDRVPMQWALTQMNLGNALARLGEREAGTGRLEAAVAAYRAALEEFPRDRVPLDWAGTQMNLGSALLTLGEREAGADRLEEAVAAYRAALEEFPRDRVPLKWAMVQMNLGSALARLGEREAGTGRLEESVAAYRAALEEYTRDRVPLDWAGTQMNLGNALQTLGEREAGTDRLQDAVAAYRAALEEFTRDGVPLDWAATQSNLGTALRTLGEREAGMERLQQAAAAYRAALAEWTRDRVPLDWAMVQGNLANLDLALFDKTGDAAHLDMAEGHARDAWAVFVAAGAGQYLATSDRILAAIAARRGG
jgi:tetratricopeptide (TPR) repeat protein